MYMTEHLHCWYRLVMAIVLELEGADSLLIPVQISSIVCVD